MSDQKVVNQEAKQAVDAEKHKPGNLWYKGMPSPNKDGRPKIDRSQRKDKKGFTLKEVIQGNVDVEDWTDIIRVAKASAQAGDWRARAWLSENGFDKEPINLNIRAGDLLPEVDDAQLDLALAEYQAELALGAGEYADPE